MNSQFLTIPTLLELKRAAKTPPDSPEKHRIAVLGNCATQHLSLALKGDAFRQGMNLAIFDADYDQILAQLMDEKSETYRFQPDIILLWMCTERLYEQFCQTPVADREHFAQTVIAQIESCWEDASSHTNIHLLQMNFIEKDDRIFGNYANRVRSSFLFQVRMLNVLLMELAGKYKNAGIIDLAALSSRYGIDEFCDSKLYSFAKMAVAPDQLPLLSREIIAAIYAMDGLAKKCVIVDLDNTLWGGVIGDDGLNGIQLGELGTGEAFHDFQLWLKELKKRGVLLAVCSKNDESVAKEPFERHPSMVLHLDDIAVFVANWEDKASNIRKIQQTLNIGMNSFVFLDDNPFERNLVREMLPEVVVPELPEDPAQYVSWLTALNLFETASFSSEDAQRTRQYQADADRNAFQKQFVAYEDYLKSLNMVATCRPFDAFHEPRIAQLIQRSNQFNLRTRRYSEQEIASFASNPDYFTAYFTLADQFGDHGLISVVILKKQDQKTLFIDSWLMSCRVLKRTMEAFIVNKIVEIARANGFSQLHGEYIPTAKNAMVSAIYEQFGFTRTAENHFEIRVDQYQMQKTYIRETEK